MPKSAKIARDSPVFEVVLARKKRRLSQAGLAKLCSISASYISKIERGELPLPASTHAMLMDAIAGYRPEGGESVTKTAHSDPVPLRISEVLRAVDPGTMIRVPMVTEVQAMGYDPSNTALDEFLEATDGAVLECQPSARYVALFAVLVRGTSLCPDYPPGSILYVDGGQLPRRGDLVVARLADEEDLLAKYYDRRQNVVTLSSGNHIGKSWTIDLKTEGHRLIWMFPVLEDRVDLRKRREWQLKMATRS